MLKYGLFIGGIVIAAVAIGVIGELAGIPSSAGVVGGAVGGVVAGYLLLRKGSKPPCPRCGTPLPQTRKPSSFRQGLWGGWTCPQCAAEVDRHGREILKAR